MPGTKTVLQSGIFVLGVFLEWYGEFAHAIDLFVVEERLRVNKRENSIAYMMMDAGYRYRMRLAVRF